MSYTNFIGFAVSACSCPCFLAVQTVKTKNICIIIINVDAFRLQYECMTKAYSNNAFPFKILSPDKGGCRGMLTANTKLAVRPTQVLDH